MLCWLTMKRWHSNKWILERSVLWCEGRSLFLLAQCLPREIITTMLVTSSRVITDEVLNTRHRGLLLHKSAHDCYNVLNASRLYNIIRFEWFFYYWLSILKNTLIHKVSTKKLCFINPFDERNIDNVKLNIVAKRGADLVRSQLSR